MIRTFKYSVASVSSILALILLGTSLSNGDNGPGTSQSQTPTAPYPNTFFDPDPHHPWNQLHGMLFIRPGWDGKLYGFNEMDPLYWPDTTYLLDGPLHQQALEQLDQFIKSDSAHLIREPLKRALLQRMLWALFDNLADQTTRADSTTFGPERRALESRLAKIMKSVALTSDEINSLPDNYQKEVDASTYPAAFDANHVETSFLPPKFFSRSDWVEVVDTHASVVAPIHVEGIGGRSGFHVLMRLPTDRTNTLAYIKKLNEFQPHWIHEWSKMVSPERLKLQPSPPPFMDPPPWVNPNLPQIPVLTEFALVRRANLINVKGQPEDSPLVETVQIRVIRDVSKSEPDSEAFYQFALDQSKLMSGSGGLVAIKKGERGFERVLENRRMPSGDYLEKKDSQDPAYNGKIDQLDNCFACHQGHGIFTMNTYNHLFDQQTLRPPELLEHFNPDDSDYWKTQRYDWGLLQAYWFEQN